MEIKVAEKGGFCWGVRRAMDIAIDTSEEEQDTLYTYGPIIHNPQVIDMLESKNVKVAKDLDHLENKTLIIRTHGITPAKRQEIKEKHIRIKDATCPLVMRVQSIIKKHARKGYHTIIIGDPNHAEIIGLLGFAEGRGHVVSSLDDVEKLPPLDPVCAVSQTTLDKEKYERIGEKIRGKFPHCAMENTICDATDERQTEVRKLASEVDAMIVVGGRNSANTTHLAEIAQAAGIPTFMVETEKEIDPAQLLNFKVIGVAAGASTPNWMIRRVVSKLEEIKLRKRDRIIQVLAHFSRFLILTNTFVALGAAFITYAACTILEIKPSLRLEAISFLYFLSMYILNSFTDEEVIRFNDPLKDRFNSRHKPVLLAVGSTSALLSLFLAFSQGLLPFLLLLGGSVLGILYSIKLMPGFFTKSGKAFRLKDIPSSKDLFSALAWCVATVLIPFYSTPSSAHNYDSLALALFFVFILVYIRCLLFDIRDIQGDRMVGRETIPIIIGKEKTKVLLFILAGLLAVVLATLGFLHRSSDLAFFLLLPVLYACGYLLLFKKRAISEGFSCELLVDGNFIFTGFVAYIWSNYHP